MRRFFKSHAGKLASGATLLYFAVSILLGATAGVGTFTFGYAQGGAYFTNDPAACANCHVMREHLDAWVKSPHGRISGCNECHSPHDLLGKYFCKGRNGLFHSWAFTTGRFPDEIQMHDYNRGVVEANCRRCHTDITHQIDPLPTASGQTQPMSCLHCHATVGHET
jgi:cytochrome c nitrite reductase small subunit